MNDGTTEYTSHSRGVLVNGGNGNSAEIVVNFSRPVESFSLQVGDIDAESLIDFSVPPTSVSGDAALVGTGDSTEVNPVVNDGLGQVHWTNLQGAISLSFSIQRPGTNAGLFFENVVASVDHDTDGDGVVDRFDLDSDNDGIADLVESGFANVSADADNNGSISVLESSLSAGGTGDSTDADGLMDVFTASIGTTPVDSEATPDGLPDFQDLDSDGDSVPDATEARASADYVAYPATILSLIHI